ncbi:RNB domain-containing ribonuclease [Sanguibacter suaedae]|uniref:RNB domain-containing ribonuclease n=1 Tax=Sanguibacter suaedae TaxID=2795737 RepID=A0A934ICB5_9MICO|nr:RNB domain-containing ribonuclease [Sanguibacter suaedae]MBI9115762.1 RNB domain-containing ribonuclease [Sanguibacter suaedae]
MPTRRIRLDLPSTTLPERIRAAFARLREEMQVPLAFPPAVLADAERSAQRGAGGTHARDTLELPFVTIDPPGSMDLDQAVHVERRPDGAKGYVVHYAIADVAHFVAAGGAVDREAHARGATFYAPDGRTPLHPPVLSEGAASLLPGEERPAAVWSITLDGDGRIEETHVRRGMVRSRARLTYAQAQEALDAGGADGGLVLLREVGLLREAAERERGGVSLDVPEQEVTVHGDGTYGLELRSVLPVEGWNAQISLLTGIAAAGVMRAGGIGVLRTLPESDERDVARLRRTARALGIDWPEGETYGSLLDRLDSRVPQHSAFFHEATSLFRGAGYVTFVGDVPGGSAHAAIAAEYAHVTAPLRRLVDRYGTEICLTLCAGGSADDVPGWVTDAFDDLPSTMARTGQRASAFDRAAVDVVEAALLSSRVGETFVGVVVDVDKDPTSGQVMLADPAVRGRLRSAAGPLPLGEEVTVRLVGASVEDRRVELVLEGA